MIRRGGRIRGVHFLLGVLALVVGACSSDGASPKDGGGDAADAGKTDSAADGAKESAGEVAGEVLVDGGSDPDASVIDAPTDLASGDTADGAGADAPETASADVGVETASEAAPADAGVESSSEAAPEAGEAG